MILLLIGLSIITITIGSIIMFKTENDGLSGISGLLIAITVLSILVYCGLAIRMIYKVSNEPALNNKIEMYIDENKKN
ncbi:hypothetical protein MFLO_15688 [Listeria floridensis FSL S10-1187]|uniref:Uncharacterized protein n=1 Tax=Listeria floridensis FSL S10-1187 TaxID=1265817 RepID=A0ABP3ATI9_9LIST|nr:hypothetical protein MFLO_15688 [Listeria floridensis FSL S10-1187]